MLEKVKLIEKRFSEIETLLQSPAIFTNPSEMSKLMKEQKELSPVVAAYRGYVQAENTVKDSRELLRTETDAEFRAMLQEESEAAREKAREFEEELRLLLIPKDMDDDKNVIIEIRGGVGGEEAALFAHSLMRMYMMYAETKRFKTEILNISETEIGGVKEVSFLVEGSGAYSRFKFESGIHRVQRVPETEAGGRIHTSAASVAVLPEADEVDIDINPGDLQIDTYRSGGAGGQHVNKTESAIRITHIPTGVVVECQDERSQYKNKDRAMKILRSKLLDAKREEQNSEIAANRRSQVGSGDRSERIRTYNFPQNRLSDHRIGLTLYKLDLILEGNLDELIDALTAADRAAKLAGGGEN